MTRRYLNWNGETVDELSSEDFPNALAFVAEMDRLTAEYASCGMPGRWSQRPMAGWHDD